jgi:hypothetical protein
MDVLFIALFWPDMPFNALFWPDMPFNALFWPRYAVQCSLFSTEVPFNAPKYLKYLAGYSGQGA